MTPAALELVLANDPAEVERLLSSVEEFGVHQEVPRKALLQVMLALEELVLNTIRYGFPDGGSHAVDVRIEADDGQLECHIRDGGIPFDPLNEAPAPDLDQPLMDRRVGGLGVHLVRKTMDEAEYRRDGDVNCTRIMKRFAEASAPQGR